MPRGARGHRLKAPPDLPKPRGDTFALAGVGSPREDGMRDEPTRAEDRAEGMEAQLTSAASAEGKAGSSMDDLRHVDLGDDADVDAIAEIGATVRSD